MLPETHEQPASPVGKNQVQVKLLFANFDGVSTVVQLDYDSSGEAVKNKVLEAWPKEMKKIDDKQRIRLLCMGKEIEVSAKTLKQLIPKYEHPTPVNISILPEGIDPAKTKSVLKQQPKSLSAKAACCIVS